MVWHRQWVILRKVLSNVSNLLWFSGSLVTGPLSSTCAYKARVTACPIDDSKGQQHVIFVYMPDVFDEAAAKKVHTQSRNLSRLS
jgi:hypothetical protein